MENIAVETVRRFKVGENFSRAIVAKETVGIVEKGLNLPLEKPVVTGLYEKGKTQGAYVKLSIGTKWIDLGRVLESAKKVSDAFAESIFGQDLKSFNGECLIGFADGRYMVAQA